MVVHFMVALLAKIDIKAKKPWPWPDNYTLKLEELITGIINKESVAVYSGGESVTFSNGLIFKQGVFPNIAALQNGSVTFGAAFPTAVISGSASSLEPANTPGSNLYSISVSQLTAINVSSTNTIDIHWQAWGY